MQETSWRNEGPYLATLASKAGLLEETRLFLLTYGQQGNVDATVQTLLHEILAQRSRNTRMTILQILRARLTSWNPPAWVLQDLVAFAQEGHLDALRAALLLHVSRQDHLLYDFVQQVLVPRHSEGGQQVFVADVQTFLDAAQETYEEVAGWSFETRLRVSRGVLAALRDYGLLKGEVNKHLTLPIIPDHVAHHLVRLLQAEGIPQEQIASHPDWRLWLWEPAQARNALASFLKRQEQIA